MGQRYSVLSRTVQDQIVALKDLTFISHEGLYDAVVSLNTVLQEFVDSKGKQILFVVKSNSDESYLWKAFTRIYCLKVDKETNIVEGKRVLDLRQFCKLYRDITTQLKHTSAAYKAEDQESNTQPASLSRDNLLCASMIFNKVDETTTDDIDECCICMDRRSEITLTCTHSYCKQCIDSWSEEHKTCPVCRHQTENEEYWEMPDVPTRDEMGQFVVGLADGAGYPR